MATSMPLPCTKSTYAGLLISAITLWAPMSFANKQDIMLASSSLVTATNTSIFSIFSSCSKCLSDTLPWSTTVDISFFDSCSALLEFSSMILTS